MTGYFSQCGFYCFLYCVRVFLYLPPGVAHWGIADGQCMTYSIGYRAPSEQEMLDDYTRFLLDRIPEHLHYQDPPLKLQKNPAEILSTANDLVFEQLNRWLADQNLQKEWFGCFVTQVKDHLVIEQPKTPLTPEQLVHEIKIAPSGILHHPYARFAFSDIDSEQLLLFACGTSYQLTAAQKPFAELICSQSEFHWSDLSSELELPQNLTLCTELYNTGYLVIEDD